MNRGHDLGLLRGIKGVRAEGVNKGTKDGARTGILICGYTQGAGIGTVNQEQQGPLLF